MQAPSPSLVIIGTVFDAEAREVPARPASPAQYDDRGKLAKQATEAREAYTAYDIRVLTEDGGFAVVSMYADHAADLFGGPGVLPHKGVEVAWRVRASIRNVFARGRWSSVIGYYFVSPLPATALGRRGATAAA